MIIKGSESMSKQSNQKYRKEKENQHLNKAGVDITAHHSEKDKLNKEKLHNEYNSFGNSSDK
jgi:hypothetical protein